MKHCYVITIHQYTDNVHSCSNTHAFLSSLEILSCFLGKKCKSAETVHYIANLHEPTIKRAVRRVEAFLDGLSVESIMTFQ